MKKRIMSLLVCISLLVGLMPVEVMATDNDSMVEVYVAPNKLGDGSESDPTSWLMAIQNVQDGGTIYVMENSVKIKNPVDVKITQEQTAAKSITVKPYHGTNRDAWLENSLIMFQTADPITVSNMTFDGSGYAADIYSYDMVYVDNGSVTLKNCIIQGHQNNDYGVALNIYSGSRVSLEGTQVIDNQSGSKRYPNTAGGASVGGTLNVDGGSRITGNSLYNDGVNPLDIVVIHGGMLNLDGGALVGTIAFSDGKTNLDVVHYTSELQHDVNLRMNRYYNSSILLAPFPVTGDILAEGADGYSLTDADVKKMHLVNDPGRYVNKNSVGQAFVNRDWSIYLSSALETTKGSFTVSAKPEGHTGRPSGSTVTITAASAEGYRYKEGTIQVINRSAGNKDITSSLTQVSGMAQWTLPILGDLELYAEFEDGKAAQTVADPAHLSGNGFFYLLMAGEDVRVPIAMVNRTQFGTGEGAPNPLISFGLADPGSEVIRLEGNTIVPLKLGSTVINAAAAETEGHRALKQPITVKVVRPLTVKLTARNYTQENGIEFTPNYMNGSEAPYMLKNTTRFLGLRKAGSTSLIPISQDQWSWASNYTQSFSGLIPDAEYEVVLRGDDNGIPANTAEAVLRFRTPAASAVDTGKIVGTVTGTGTITVRVERGNTVIANKTGLSNNDEFSFTNLPDGFYNLVAENGNYTVTVMVQVKDGGTTNLHVLYVGEKQSTVMVGNNAPLVAVDRLGGLFEKPMYADNGEATNAIAGGGTVEIRLTANAPDAVNADKIPVEAIVAAAVNKKVGLLVNLTIDMIITPRDALGRTILITDTESLVEIALPIPEDIKGKSGYQITRFHDGAVSNLPETASGTVPAVESFYISGNYAHIFAQKFSTYGITYDAGGSSTGGGHGSPGKTNYTLTYGANGGNPLSSASYREDQVVQLTQKPTRKGYIFLGWFADSKLTQRITEIKMSKNCTVYAKWVQVQIPQMLNGQDHEAYIFGYEDGTIRPDADITRGEVAQIFCNLLRPEVRESFETEPNGFTDVPQLVWYSTAVSTLAKAGIISGYGDGTFKGDGSITRAEFAVVAARFSENGYSGDDLFSDIGGHWGRMSINSAAAMGWVEGFGGSEFKPDENMTRAQAVALVNGVLCRMPETAENLRSGMKAWPDNANLQQWYYLAIQEAANSHTYERHSDGIHESWTALQ